MTQQSEEAQIQTGNACIVCWRSPTDRAHLIDRSLAPDPYGDPRRVVFLCREHHDAYDAHTLNLLPYLEPHHRSEMARAVEVYGLMGTLERVSGHVWEACGPMRPAAMVLDRRPTAGGLEVV